MSRDLNIAMVYNYDPNRLDEGGGIVYVHNLVTSLLAAGHNVTLLGMELGGDTPENPSNFRTDPVLNRKWGKGAYNWAAFMSKLWFKAPLTSMEEIDLIHAHHPLAIAPFLVTHRETPTICTFHGVPLHWIETNHPRLYFATSKLYLPLEKAVVRKVDAITTAGRYPRNNLIDRYPMLELESKVHVIPSGIDLDQFYPREAFDATRRKYSIPDDREVIFFAGRISKEKNLELLIDAADIVARERDITLVIAGRGEQYQHIRKYADNTSIVEVVFTGMVNHDEVAELMSLAAAFCLTSKYEASPTVIKESLACGTPVVSTHVGDVDEIVTDRNLGVICQSFDQEDYAEAISKVLERRTDSPEAIERACRRKADTAFGFEMIRERFEEVYYSIVGEAD